MDLQDSRRALSRPALATVLRGSCCLALGIELACVPSPSPSDERNPSSRGEHEPEHQPEQEPSTSREPQSDPSKVVATTPKDDVDTVQRRAAACRAAHPTNDAAAAHVVKAACSDLASLDIPGLVILVRQGETTRFRFAHGSMDLAGEHPVDVESTAFRIGSLTKLVTTWLALQAAQDGKLALEATLGTYLHELAQTPAGDVTIHDLLAHRSGLPELEPKDLLLSGTSTWLSRVASFERTQPASFAYRNLDHALVGEVLRRVYDTTWAELVRDQAGIAVGLDIHGDLAIEARISPGHPRWPGRTTRMTVPHRAMLEEGPLAASFTHPAGGLVATADALADFALALTTTPGRSQDATTKTRSLQVSDTTRALLLGRTTRADEPCWTLGFSCLDRGPSRPLLLRHAGNTGDSSAELWIDPATERVVVVLANAPEFPRNAALAAVQRYLELDPAVLRMAYTPTDPAPTGVESPP